MAKPTGAICNLDCEYCFYLAKKRSTPVTASHADDRRRDYVRQLIEAQDDAEVTVAWQGGEPTLMGLAFFRRPLRTRRTLPPPGPAPPHTIQTNGTLLDEVWCEFLADKGFLVGISIDGPPSSTTATESTSGAVPPSDRSFAASSSCAHEVEFNVLCTVHAANRAPP